MYTLFYSPGAASLVVHQLLIELGVPFETRLTEIDKGEHKTAAFLAINPAGVLPAMLIDGQARTEAAALLQMIGERHPESGLVPAASGPVRDAYLQWTFFMANTLQPLFRRWFYPDDAAGEANADEVKDVARRQIEAGWDLVDKHLAASGGYMTGPDFTALDMLTTMLMRWSRNMPKPANRWPHIAAYLAKTTARPSFVEVHKREGLEIWPPR
jgi:glutathione S-transferase